MLDGSAIRHTEAVPLQRAIDNAVVLQYGVGSVERFKQCNYKDKVLIVDNFHLSKMNESGRNVVLSHFEGLFKYIVLMASEGLQFRELTNETDETKKLLSYQHCQLRDFGLRLRGRLIEKWFSLGNELVSDEREIVHKVKCAETLIGTLLGKNLLPSQPFFVLTMLQQFEAMSNLDAASGAYGHYYEFLIK